jgi:hypothetical protein
MGRDLGTSSEGGSVTVKATHVAGVIAVAGALGYWQGNAGGRESERDKAKRANVAALVETVKVVDRKYDVDTVPMWRTKRIYDSTRITDTVPVVVTRPGKPDTVVIYTDRDAADNALNACWQSVRSCEARVSARDRLIDSLRDQLKDSKRPRGGLAAGLLYEPQLKEWGAFIEKDWRLLRLNVTVTRDAFAQTKAYLGLGIRR